MLCSSRFCLPPVFFGYQNVLIDISNASYRSGFNSLDIIQDIGYDASSIWERPLRRCGNAPHGFAPANTTASSIWERIARIRDRRLLLAKMNLIFLLSFEAMIKECDEFFRSSSTFSFLHQTRRRNIVAINAIRISLIIRIDLSQLIRLPFSIFKLMRD